MKIEVKREDLGKSKIKLTVKVPSVLMVKYFEKIYAQMSPKVEVKGFRKGMAPKHLTIAAIGEDKFSQEIINLALNETYGAALDLEKIIPIASPKISIRMIKDLLVDAAEMEYEAEVELLPEVAVGDYKKAVKSIKSLKSKSEIEVGEEEIDQVLKHLQQQHASFADKEGMAVDGDRIEMDFEGNERGVILENLTSKNYPVILGSKVLLPEFEKEIIGLKKGDDKEFDVMLGKPDASKDPSTELGAGKKKVHFKVKIHTVQSVQLPELNDEFAGKFEQQSLEKLTLAIKKDIVEQKTIAQKRNIETEIADALVKIAKIEVPEVLIEQETHRMLNEMRSRTEMMGLPFEQYLIQLKKTEADLHQDFKEQAEKTVKVGLILGEIGRLEKIDLKAEDAGRKVMERLLSYAQN